jgi:DNA-binding CsgD family transcriptional regulator
MGLNASVMAGLDEMVRNAGASRMMAAESILPTLTGAEEFIPAAQGRTNFTPAEERVLKLLADGHSQTIVASTLGLQHGTISGYLSNDDFREELARRKAIVLEKYKKLDDGYDRAESVLLEKLEANLMFLTRPMEIVAALTRINAMKRRLGVSEAGSSNPASTVVNITLPVQIVHKFTTTAAGHIVGIDDKSLVTIPSGQMSKFIEKPTEVVQRISHVTTKEEYKQYK